jgi:hypothetical protein
LGGTVVTITGENFSDEQFTDNAVRIGDDDCILESTSTTQIVCKIEKKAVVDFSDYKPKEVPVTVFLRLSDHASCGLDSCKFTYNKP